MWRILVFCSRMEAMEKEVFEYCGFHGMARKTATENRMICSLPFLPT